MFIKRRTTVVAEAEQWDGSNEAAVAALAQKVHQLTDPDDTVSYAVHDENDPPPGLYLTDDVGGYLLFRIELGSWLVFDPDQTPSMFQMTDADFTALYQEA